jgi:chromate reductase
MSLLFFAGSARKDSVNKKLASLLHRIAEANGVGASLIDLADYRMPLYDGDEEKTDGVPQAARDLKAVMKRHQGVFIASPEYNASFTPLLKNTLDWVSRPMDDGDAPLEVFKTRIFAIGSASPSYFGGVRSLIALRQVLALGLGAMVIPQQIIVPTATKAYDDKGHLSNDVQANDARNLVEALTVAARKFAA